MADVIDYKIVGDDMQLVEVELDPGEGVRAEAGAMMFMESGIEMQTSTGGGLFKGFKRMITGESFFITTFLYNGSGKGHVAFGAPYPGKIIPLDMSAMGGQFRCQKDAFLCAAQGIEIEVAFTKKIGAGLFGGEGFILQRLEGDGMAFIHAGGTILKRELAAGENLRVDTGCLVAFAPSVGYDIQFVGGFKNALFWRRGHIPREHDRARTGVFAEPAVLPPGGPHLCCSPVPIARREEGRGRSRRRFAWWFTWWG